MTTTPEPPQEPFGAGQPPYPGPQPPYPGAQQPYGAYPTGPGGGPRQAPPAPPQPPSIALAVKLMWVGGALSIISLIYSFATIGSLKDDVREQLVKDDPTVSESTIDAAFAIGVAFAIVFGLAGALLWAWMAWKNGQGRSWARVVATVLGALNLFGLLYTFAGGNSEPITVVLSLVTVALAVVILILLWRKESTQFYEATTASRRLY